MYKPSCYFQNPRHAPCHHFASPLLPRFQSRVLVSYFAEMTLPLHSTLLAFVPWLTTGLFTGAPSPAIGDTKDSRLGCSSSARTCGGRCARRACSSSCVKDQPV